MNRRPVIAVVFFVFFIASAYADDDFYPQKVGVSYNNKGDFAGICSLLQKTLFSLAEGDTNIVLYSGDKSDLETLDVKEINANITITLATSGLNYQVVLYRTGDKPVLLDDTVVFGKGCHLRHPACGEEAACGT